MSQSLLEGIRVLDLTMAYAGPIGTRILADMGAEVIKIESIQRIDMPTRKIGYPNNEPGKDPWNRGGYFHRLNVNKKGITLDLNHPKGRDIFLRLAKISDIVIESYSPRVMENFKLGYDVLKDVKPDIIMVSMSGFGHSGPHQDYTAYMPGMEAASGFSSITGYVDGRPLTSGTGYGDWVLGVTGMAAALTALYYRQRTGKGQYVDASGQEAIICHLGDAVMDYVMNQRVEPRSGNKHRSMAPQGCYRCKGEDEWINIAVETEEQWRSLCKVLGEPAWTREERFSDPLSRWKNQGELDSLIEGWTRNLEKRQAMDILQQAGVPAGAVLNVKEVMTDPHLLERGAFEVIDHPGGIGKFPHPKQMAAIFSKSPKFIPKAAPTLGQDNEYVLTNLLEMSQEDISGLEKEGIIGTTPSKFVAGKERPLPIDLMVKEGAARLEPEHLEQLSSAYHEKTGP